MTLTAFTLIDGSLSTDPRARRQDLVRRMAADLFRFEAAHSEPDAIRSLYGTRRYAMADIVMLVDDARQVAVQEIVSQEMSAS